MGVMRSRNRPCDQNRERVAGGAVSSGNAALIAKNKISK